MFLLDTNVISETSRKRPDPQVVSWLQDLWPDQWQVSVVTDYELELGLVGLRHRDVEQALVLERWLSHAREGYAERMLPVTAEIARRCAAIQVPNRRSLTDALIAATALQYGLTVATRNVGDFDVPGLNVINPFAEAVGAR